MFPILFVYAKYWYNIKSKNLWKRIDLKLWSMHETLVTLVLIGCQKDAKSHLTPKGVPTAKCQWMSKQVPYANTCQKGGKYWWMAKGAKCPLSYVPLGFYWLLHWDYNTRLELDVSLGGWRLMFSQVLWDTFRLWEWILTSWRYIGLWYVSGLSIYLIVLEIKPCWIMYYTSWRLFWRMEGSGPVCIVTQCPFLSDIAMQHVLLVGPGLLIWSLLEPYLHIQAPLRSVKPYPEPHAPTPYSTISYQPNLHQATATLHQNFMSYLRAFYIRRYVVYTKI